MREPDSGGKPDPPHTYLCFDFGERRIGVAVGQALTGTASIWKRREPVPSMRGVT